MDEIKDKIILAVKKAITNRAEVVDCYHDIMEIDGNDVDHIAEEVADALIAANIGDVTAYKAEAEYWKTICKFEGDEYHTTIKNAAEHARHLMQERDEWKERAEKEKTEKNKWKCTANDWKQRFESREKQLAELRTTSCEAVIRKDRVISEQKSEIDRLSTERDEYKHRAEVAEREVAEEEQIMANRCGEGKCEYFESIRRAANNNREYGYCKKYKQDLHLYDWWWLKCNDCIAEKELAEEKND